MPISMALLLISVVVKWVRDLRVAIKGDSNA